MVDKKSLSGVSAGQDMQILSEAVPDRSVLNPQLLCRLLSISGVQTLCGDSAVEDRRKNLFQWLTGERLPEKTES